MLRQNDNELEQKVRAHLDNLYALYGNSIQNLINNEHRVFDSKKDLLIGEGENQNIVKFEKSSTGIAKTFKMLSKEEKISFKTLKLPVTNEEAEKLRMAFENISVQLKNILNDFINEKQHDEAIPAKSITHANKFIQDAVTNYLFNLPVYLPGAKDKTPENFFKRDIFRVLSMYHHSKHRNHAQERYHEYYSDPESVGHNKRYKYDVIAAFDLGIINPDPIYSPSSSPITSPNVSPASSPNLGQASHPTIKSAAKGDTQTIMTKLAQAFGVANKTPPTSPTLNKPISFNSNESTSLGEMQREPAMGRPRSNASAIVPDIDHKNDNNHNNNSSAEQFNNESTSLGETQREPTMGRPRSNARTILPNLDNTNDKPNNDSPAEESDGVKTPRI
ncbi:MAG: hypothetical protein H0W64_01805 [Gammaproteobacteria bacterium]|nr:hypothetical protein [Gammaproteobacteria bacterium]